MDHKDLVFGFIVSPSVRGPVDVARCRVEVTGDVHPSQFGVTIENATADHGNLIGPPPVVVRRGGRR